jgi:Family of unknown function (DUF6526)
MKKQIYSNHKRYYFPHHLVFYPLVLILNIICFNFFVNDTPNQALWLMNIAIINLVCFLALMLRQHYALGNQDRIIRLEMRLRYYILTQQRFENIELKLSKKQIYALRFASDEELPFLINRCLQENLSPDEIKSSIKNWQVDDMRL